LQSILDDGEQVEPASAKPVSCDVLNQHVFPLGSWRANSPSRSRVIEHEKRPDIREQSNLIDSIGVLANEEESIYAGTPPEIKALDGAVRSR